MGFADLAFTVDQIFRMLQGPSGQFLIIRGLVMGLKKVHCWSNSVGIDLCIPQGDCCRSCVTCCHLVLIPQGYCQSLLHNALLGRVHAELTVSHLSNQLRFA